MPVHFNSFIADEETDLKTKLFSDIVTKLTDNAEDIFVSEDKRQILMSSYFNDINTNEKIGKVVITLIVRNDSIELVDTDIVLLTNNKIKLNFEEKLEESSEANEYYLVYDSENNRHFDIETVNRYIIPEDIEGKEKDVYLSAFPFQLNVFESEEEMNEFFGLGKEIDIPKLGKQVLSMDPRMISDGRLVANTGEPCSLIIGEVKGFKDVEANIADNTIRFKIIDLDTGIGHMPVAAHEENFDLSKLKKKALIGMLADLKADFKK